MKQLSRQDRNGTRNSEELRRRYTFQDIDYTKEEIEKLKIQLVVDEHLSATSTNAIQNKAVTNALNTKVAKETGKGLSSNDFTDEDKEKLNNATSNNHTHSNKTLLDSYTQTEENLASAVSNSHTHTNKTVLDGITSDDIKAWNNLATYEDGGTTDADTTTDPLILTKVNAPTTDFWYIKTLFYSSISNTSNRKQIAYSYKFDAPIYTRYFNSGTWSEWTTGEIKSSNIEDYSGHLWFKNGMLLQWGTVTIKPTAADTVASTEVTFTHTYDFIPFITAIPQIAYPKDVTCSIGGGTTENGAKAGMKIYMTRTNTSETSYRWFAVGYKSN